MRKIFIPAIAALALSSFTMTSCGGSGDTSAADSLIAKLNEVKFNEVKVDSLYSMSLPDYLTEGNDLNDEASLQYQNIYKEVYVIVIDEPKQDFIDVFKEIGEYDEAKTPIDNYAESQMKSIEETMEKVTKKSEWSKKKINGNDARVADVAGTQAGIEGEMGFKAAFVEGKENLYMIMTWTFESSKDKYEADMNKMIESFKEQ
jgi:hypothetical protein